jgi:hypothetical protein
MLAKLSLMLFLIASTDVKMPTMAIMPNAMISTVIIVRSICPRIDRKAIFIFSLTTDDAAIPQRYNVIVYQG